MGACPLLDKTAISVADAFFSNIVCRFGMPSVIHSDQGREFENKVMHELCLLYGGLNSPVYILVDQFVSSIGFHPDGNLSTREETFPPGLKPFHLV